MRAVAVFTGGRRGVARLECDPVNAGGVTLRGAVMAPGTVDLFGREIVVWMR